MKGEISGGYGYFPGSDVKSGFLFALEPKYGIMDQLYIGAKFETALQYGSLTAAGNGYPYKYDVVKIYESLSITADYYFTNNFSVRPFVGVGGGVHLLNITNSNVDYNSSIEDGSSTKIFFGGLARVGVEIQRFRLGLEYNLNANTKSGHDEYNSTTGYYYTVYDISKNSYIAIKAGVFFGGGPRERKRRRHRD